MAAVAALPPRTQEELLDAIQHSIYNQPPTDWSQVTNLGLMRAVPEVKETVNLATQYMKAGYDPQAFIARLAEIVCHDNFTEMHAFKHHQSIVEEYHAHPRAVALDAPRLRRPGRGDLLRQEHDDLRGVSRTPARRVVGITSVVMAWVWPGHPQRSKRGCPA